MHNLNRQATSFYSSLRSGYNSLRGSLRDWEGVQDEDTLCLPCLDDDLLAVETEDHFCLECPSMHFDRHDMLRNIRQSSFELENSVSPDLVSDDSFPTLQTFWDHWQDLSPATQTDILLGGQSYSLDSDIHIIPPSVLEAVMEVAIPALYGMYLERG
jgi:hypothetical protein